ncbi:MULTISPECIES: alpha/beta fold hydrolase [unclassified Rhizobium]|uniref:RBBP9/YdeN family alpha/beta hydrolase n=1 Tax=unclassified Rhizobium TaxID=2613769 RepID=UPI001A98269A|nr:MULTISPECIES: alpha/beta fold hydrolase [unclassified Rhizobium]MBX5156708.1 serine hydrolase family protein [Rhizobium sp. NZLR8]MBX5162834.1 serine hydrolase family protein [Rhizobium sp. NZLR4b]MBX5168427.1 serine hydrolase family protein [Rhizobium sp. NZLR1b]MBX5181963.1 serine hydrolase family protein [Rhizobium sp. NZLR5]MBX5187693.1 serine hydrolase family protein [Rhizobium sp. NZLR3b]
MSDVLILPGLFGSGEGHWQQHWLQDQPGSCCVVQDDWDHPDLDNWLPRLEGALEEAGEAYLVAHSLGCLLAARLAGRSAARRVKGALLVAPCDLPVTEILHPGHIAFDGMPTAPLPFPSIVVGSMNDAYMTVDRLTLFGRLWKAETRNIGLAGHINIASGFGRWRNGYRLLDALTARIVSARPAFAM